MKHYDSIPSIIESGELKGEMVWGFNKLDGQNFVITFKPKKSCFGPYGSRTHTVDINDLQFGNTVSWFLSSDYPDILSKIVKDHCKKGDVFQGIDEITFVFEWYGPNSFAGKHDPEDEINKELRLALIDVFLKKKGYMEPKTFYELFNDSGVEIPELIYKGPLNQEIIEKIQKNNWTQAGAELPTVKEGVVFKRSTMMKGQRRPSVKVKTKWWLDKLHSLYPPDKWKELE